MIIYCVRNKVNGKRYIGQTTKSLDVRWRQHKYMIKSLVNTPFYNALRKYGPDNFSVTLIKLCSTQQEMDDYEKSFISLYKTLNHEFGYNSHPGGAPKTGYAPTAAQRHKMSLSMINKWKDPKFRAFRKASKGRYTVSKDDFPVKMAKCHPDRFEYRSKLGRSQYLCYQCAQKLCSKSYTNKERKGDLSMQTNEITKNCRKCGLPKDRDEFPWKNKSKGIRHNTCKSCTRTYSGNYYKANQEELAERAKLHQRELRASKPKVV